MQTDWDIIGDLHGCATMTNKLLEKLGYSLQAGKYRHAKNRNLAFLGDFFDRGEEIVETLRLVKKLVDDGIAKIVLGNHETSFLMAYALDGKNLFKTPSRILHSVNQSTLRAYAKRQAEFYSILDWLLTQPLILELDNFRLAHASWHDQLFAEFFDKYPNGIVDLDFMAKATEPNTFAYRVMEIATQGIVFDYPFDYKGMSADGNKRRKFRTKFWLDENATKTYGDVFFHPFAIPAEISNLPLPAKVQQRLLHYSVEQKKLFVGHYWLNGAPKLLAPNIACVDYSAVKKGKLMCYRYSGEAELTDANFIFVE